VPGGVGEQLLDPDVGVAEIVDVAIELQAQQSIGDTGNADALSGLMSLYVAQNQAAKAVEAAKQQIAIVPGSSAFHDLLGTVLFDNIKDMRGAEAEFRKATELDRTNVDAFLKLGQLQTATGQVDAALATYQQGISSNSLDVRFYILAGQIYELKRDPANAKASYQKALAIQPNNAYAANNLALLMLQEGDDVNSALAMAETARRAMPDSPSTADTLGWAYYRKGVYPSAIDLFKEALKKSPDNPTYHYHLGLAYQKASQPGLAKEHLERVLKIKPDYVDADGVRKALADLRS